MKITGIVKKGLGIGRTLGWPTANIAYGGNEMPARGVYAGWAFVNGTQYPAAVVVAAREETPPLIEAHLIGFEGELLGASIEIEIVELVSEVEEIADEVALKEKIRSDVQKVKKICSPAS